ncbi:copper amine oxidase N-terminal domain-containing protein [Paenibacillus macerans]|uniref:copper amine oxidase N-terminal domain-containing protein n=1 Tax=Paenibacillus macerans TaxID=44252 RepID=UPI002041CABC|nr:copper amine oxidase N-terminal domain-containing protein [Paenibacillus macerans]MCM3698431.1 copper amine oxidase N-terminal domain-containing protein [Paenibacillus macerans]
MKWRRVAVLAIAFSLMGGSMLFADAASQKVKLLLNGRELEDGGYIIDGKTYVPLRNLEGLADYNEETKTVNYYKPNVHMSLSSEEGVFGDIKKTGKLKFYVFSQIDNLKTNISAVRVSITAPDGTVKEIQTDEIKEQRDNFWFRTKDYTYDFKATGQYTVGFYMKPAGGTDFVLVSEKGIKVLE